MSGRTCSWSCNILGSSLSSCFPAKNMNMWLCSMNEALTMIASPFFSSPLHFSCFAHYPVLHHWFLIAYFGPCLQLRSDTCGSAWVCCGWNLKVASTRCWPCWMLMIRILMCHRRLCTNAEVPKKKKLCMFFKSLVFHITNVHIINIFGAVSWPIVLIAPEKVVLEAQDDKSWASPHCHRSAQTFIGPFHGCCGLFVVHWEWW